MVDARVCEFNATLRNSDGNFELSDGSFGNPGCDDCGESDAVIKINGRYYCESGLEEWLVARNQMPAALSCRSTGCFS